MSKPQPTEALHERPPVVVVLGHVDHGKTTLLDTIRKTNIAGRESGGITQHVGAYVIEHEGKPITFLDTPGHAAFSAMRSRGANVADIAILVVAADDGMQPQTHEALEAIRSADIPFVVAINKVDKPNADLDKTKGDLTNAGVLLEGWGGDVPNAEISAKEGTNIDALLELVQLLADISELTGDQAKPGRGVVVETHQDPQRGVLATVLVKDGTLRQGDAILAGAVTGKVKALEAFDGEGIKEAGPSVPAVVLGFSEVPEVGDTVRVMENEKEASAAAEEEQQRRAYEVTIAEGEPDITLPVVVKADVRGSLEALIGELEKLRNPHVAIQVVGASTGDVSENDVKQASAMEAAIFAFRVKTKNAVMNVAERHQVRISVHDVIYELLDDLKAAAADRLPKIVHRKDLGTLKVLQTFQYEHPTHVIGGRVESGIAKKGALLEIVRDDEIVGRAEMTELQRDKIPVDQVEQGRECGMLAKYVKGGPIKEGDVIRFFEETVETPSLE